MSKLRNGNERLHTASDDWTYHLSRHKKPWINWKVIKAVAASWKCMKKTQQRCIKANICIQRFKEYIFYMFSNGRIAPLEETVNHSISILLKGKNKTFTGPFPVGAIYYLTTKSLKWILLLRSWKCVPSGRWSRPLESGPTRKQYFIIF